MVHVMLLWVKLQFQSKTCVVIIVNTVTSTVAAGQMKQAADCSRLVTSISTALHYLV